MRLFGDLAAGDVTTTLETPRLTLRVPRFDDADAFFDGFLDDPEVMEFLGGETVPREDVPDVLRKWLGRWEANGVGPFVLERREDGRVVGRAGVIVWDTRSWTNSTLEEAGEYAQHELGWALGREFWGNGYATEAARAVRDWARGHGVERLISLIDPKNVRSNRVAARLGATPTETVTLSKGSPAVVWVHPDSN
jgi:RimJ/RimL family protein N-acetyltransferase